MRGILKAVLISVCAVLIAATAGFVLLFAVYCLPTEPMFENAKDDQYDLYYWSLENTSQLDPYSEDAMVNTAIYSGDESVLEQTVMNYHMGGPDLGSIRSLDMYLKGEDGMVREDYTRYWHGYLVYLKPLLSVLSISRIKVLQMSLQLLMLFAVVLCIYKRNGLMTALAFFISMLVVNPVSMAICIEFANIYNIMLIAILVMYRFELFESGKVWKLFLGVGICVAYFDLMSFPLLSLAIPLILYLVNSREDGRTQFGAVCASSFAWVFGYGGMWVSKWVISDLIYHNGALSESFSQVAMRSSGGQDAAESTGIFDAVTGNLGSLSIGILLFFFIFTVYLFVLIWKRRNSLDEKAVKGSLMPLLIGLYPFVWMIVVREHSAAHHFFAHRLFAITFLALLVTFTGIAESGKAKE